MCCETPIFCALERMVDQTGVLLVSDEVYEHVVFDRVPHRSVMRSPMLAARSVVISSFGKTFHTTGWKVGYACAPAPISAEIRKVHQFMVFAVNTPAQHAFAEHLADPRPYLDLPDFYQAKRDLFVQGLADTPFRALPCEDLLRARRLLADIESDRSRVCEETGYGLWRCVDSGVRVLRHPVEHQVVRFCFAKEDRTLQQALAFFGAGRYCNGFLSRVPNGTGITSMPSSFKSAASSFDAIPRIERFGASS